ncbi:response regulator transcription factor [Streptomyces sp. CA-142005]|uniref:response regulator transcription factor n=1 Tax=Streptomyces sp. CA-142005 TaxID=3240052 RepID=UPI003D916CBA
MPPGDLGFPRPRLPATRGSGQPAPGRVPHRPQRDILRFLAGGLSNAAIAFELGLTEGTVNGHVSQVMERLGATNRVEAARVAFRAGL